MAVETSLTSTSETFLRNPLNSGCNVANANSRAYACVFTDLLPSGGGKLRLFKIC